MHEGTPHTHHPADGSLWEMQILLPALALSACAVGYVVLAHRARRRNPVRALSPWRGVGFLTGLALLSVALLPPVASLAHSDFRGHMAQHMLIGMYAPLALVLGAPVTLLLRALPAPGARRLTALLHSRPARFLAHPAVALLLSTGSLAPLYFTPLLTVAMAHPAGHRLLLAHFLLSGCLFAHAIAGPDPAPRRLGVRARLIFLGCAIAAHSVMAQLMYGGFWVDVHAPVPEVQGGAEIMYYGGDIAELLLAAALVATWRPERRARTAVPASASCGPARA
ncbi:cytochrome c oxidase assembly protein [Streptomyces sp. NPDC048521]|uniref:cytochrome c oxidase assembly protein n=1 Tax=Streptomyces sp. NPDC048521 TaxID=3365566 RepID=UPI00371F3E66